ncbi:beta-ketoacyl synthase N-terminal-like domain-containing protein [Pseudomonas orientalis]|uniref:beta-ketoacyl synthase N-terminal-like domain-containing protein n=1 Tax=Pseudomonas orientalis TaxID=76758 RepID=UPI0015E7CAF9|nr:beta-ketoacyl synthase N-terminal-like domain-containing protein [Pseudomonas orientalis]MBA1429392.1 FAD-binding protein [Pseudomonas orientalis]
MTMKTILDELRDGRLSIEQAKARLRTLQAPLQARPAPEPVAVEAGDIAIISMAGRFPGAASVEQFWDNLRAGVDSITQVPATRWDTDTYYSAQKGEPGKAYCRWGGFIEDVDCFDSLFFGISPREAQLMDPQERLLLQEVWTLFERIGYTRAYLAESCEGEVGVFTGSMYQQYHAFDTDVPRKATVALSSTASMANRISHFFNLKGPSLALDTMCSSAATALHLACDSLRSGSCRLAVVGATNLSIHPFKYIALCQGQLLASDPGVRAYGQTDGFLPGETVAAVLLKPLKLAIEDGDTVTAVIKSTAISHKGYTPGYSVPSAAALETLLCRHFQRSGIDPRSVDYVETSASGATLGDVAEFQALRTVYGTRDGQLPQCHLGSVKSNIGHAEAAIGLAQVIKVALQLRDRVRVPSILTEPLNPQARADEAPLRVQRSLEHWNHPSDAGRGMSWPTPRRAAVHTFAAGGANAHLLLQAYAAAPAAVGPTSTPGPWLLVFSAASNERLQVVLAQTRQALATTPSFTLDDLAFTLGQGREAMPCRVAWVLRDPTALLSTVEAAQACVRLHQGSTDGVVIHYGDLEEADPPGAASLARASLSLEERARAWVDGQISLQEATRQVSLRAGRRIVELPTYPFARVHCWLPGSDTLNSPATPATPAMTQVPEVHCEDVQGVVRAQIGALTHIEPYTLQLGKPLLDYGLNSVTMLVLAACLCQALDGLDESRDGPQLVLCRTAGELIERLENMLAPTPPSITGQEQPSAAPRVQVAPAAGNPAADNYVPSEQLQMYHRNGYAFDFAHQPAVLPERASAGKRAVVLGAGPAGLVAALTLAANGFEQVYVVEKRTSINRMQMVTLYPHTLPYLKSLGVLDAVARRAAPIARHDFYLNRDGQRTRYFSRELPAGILDRVDASMAYGDETVAELFVGESVMAISLADLQAVLMEEACARGVRFIADHHATVVRDDSAPATWQVLLSAAGAAPQRPLDADLVVVADGARSAVAQAAGIDCSLLQTPRGSESWYVFHCASDVAISRLSYEFAFDPRGRLDHCAFGLAYPVRKEFGVAFYSRVQTPPALDLLQDKADFFAKSWGVHHQGINWLTKRIAVHHSRAERVVDGNLLLVGDAAGTGSPNAGLGSGLAISAYGWALNEYCRRALTDREAAADFYQVTASRYPLAWQSRSLQIWEEINSLAAGATPERQTGT